MIIKKKKVFNCCDQKSQNVNKANTIRKTLGKNLKRKSNEQYMKN